MTACGAGVIGSVASFSGTAAAEESDPYDGGRTTVIDDSDGEDFAEVHTAVTGPKQVPDDWQESKMALAMPVSYGDQSTNNGLNNVDITCELIDSPCEGTGFDFRHIDPYSPGENGELDPELKYAIDVAWECMSWFLRPPSPTDLMTDSDDTSVSNKNGEFCIERDDGPSPPPSADWEVDFTMDYDTDRVPVGDWKWELTASGDVGYHDPMHGRGPGFQVLGDFEHTHEIELTVYDHD